MLQLQTKPFPVLITNRLRLRKMVDADLYSIFRMRSEEASVVYLQAYKFSDIEDAKTWIIKMKLSVENNHSIYWVIADVVTNEMLGSISLWNFQLENFIGEAGYGLLAENFGKGIMSEALKAVTEYGFKQLQLKSIEAFTRFDNAASINLLLKNGFVLIKDRKDDDVPENIIFVLSNPYL